MYGNLSVHTWWQIRLDPVMNQPSESPAGPDQESAVVVFTEPVDCVRLIWQWVLRGRPRFQSPERAGRSGPKRAVAVLVQTEDACANPRVFIALYATVLNRAELAGGNPINADPHHAVAILQKNGYVLSGKFWVRCDRGALPTGEAFSGADPKSPVTPRGQ